MSFRGRVARIVRTVRGDGSTAVDIGSFQPTAAGSVMPAAVTLWTADGTQYAAFALESTAALGKVAAYIGLGKVGEDWTPALRFPNRGGVDVMADRTKQTGRLGFYDLDPLSAKRNGDTVIDFDTVQTSAIHSASGGRVAVDSDPYTPAPLAAGWTNYGSPAREAGYRLEVNGDVRLRGLVQGGAGVVFTLPPDYRPPAGKTEIFITGASTGVADVRVSSDGSVTVAGYYAGGTNGSVSLSGIVFTPGP